MKKIYLLCSVGLILLMGSCKEANFDTTLTSPSGTNSIVFEIDQMGAPYYIVDHNNSRVIDTSGMGFDFKDQTSLKDKLKIVKVSKNTYDETWEMPWGEQREVRNHYKEMVIDLEETRAPKRKLTVHFKAYDDGVAFRYIFHGQEGRDSITITDENTQFKLTGNHDTWWIPGDWDIYEHRYQTTKLADIFALALQNNADLASTHIPENAVNTPITMRTEEGLHLAFHEANLTDYAGMTLKVDTAQLGLVSALVGSDRLGHKVKKALPAETPWRTVQISEDAGGLIESRLIENLNEPNKLGDVSWFTPMKYVGIWWEMHLGLSTWDLEGTQDMNTFATLGKEQTSSRHGASTANTKRYIDFAAANGFGGVLVEGWNIGWDHWIGFDDREGVFDFVTPYEDYDIDEINRYAKEKGVEMIMHHETSAAPRTYEKQMEPPMP